MSTLRHIALLSIHTSPLAALGGKEAGGMNVYVGSLARALGQQGIQVDIFTRRATPDLAPVVFLAPGVRLVHLSAGPAAPYNKNLILGHLPDLLRGIEQFAAQQGACYDLIYSHYWVSGEVALALRQHWKLPVLQMFHTLGVMKNAVARGAEETETQERIAIERRLLRDVDMTVAATSLDRDQMVQHYAADPARIRVIPAGVDTELFRPRDQAAARADLGLPADQTLLLCVGRMEPLKGIDALVRALALRHNRLPHLRSTLGALLVGGAPEDTPTGWNGEQRRLAALRDEQGVAQAVIFAGAQPHARLRDYYAAADIFVMPSHYESFGLAALEAMACGTPVVASGVGGLTTIIEHNHSGLLAPPDDPPALADQIERLLREPELRARLRAGGLQRAAAYSWQQVAAQISALAGELLLQRAR